MEGALTVMKISKYVACIFAVIATGCAIALILNFTWPVALLSIPLFFIAGSLFVTGLSLQFQEIMMQSARDF